MDVFHHAPPIHGIHNAEIQKKKKKRKRKRKKKKKKRKEKKKEKEKKKVFCDVIASALCEASDSYDFGIRGEVLVSFHSYQKISIAFHLTL